MSIGAASLSPLASRPLIRATDRDQLVDQLRQAYKVRGVDFAGGRGAPAGAIANRVLLDGVGLHYCRYDAPTEIKFSEMEGYRQFFCLSGSGSVSVAGRRLDISEEFTGIIPPDVEFDAAYGEAYQHLVVQFSASALHRRAELITGRDLSRLPPLPLLERLSTGNLRRLKAIALALAHQFGDEADAADIVIAELSQALTGSFLTENLRGVPGLIPGPPRTSGWTDVSRLEDYIHANWDKPLTVEDVAAACGVSVRSVFARFKQARGVTPMVYIRDVRLERANRRLLDGDGEVSVLDVALACGFASFGHFARRYREKFGELPSATVARGRGRRSR